MQITHFPSLSKQCTRGHAAGITFVEVIVILAVVAILATISGTALFSHMGRSDLKRASRTIVSLLQSARVEAIKRNAETAVFFNNTSQTCTVYLDNGDGSWGTTGDNTRGQMFPLSTMRSRILLAGLTKTTFVFTPKGRLDPPSGSVLLTNEAGESMNITVRISGSILTQ